MRIAVLHNPVSTRNHGRKPPDAPEGVRIHSPTDHAELDDVLGELSRADIDLLVIDGGDGTIRDVVSRLPEKFAHVPALAVLPSGNTNLVARTLGALPGYAALSDLTPGRFARRSSTVPVLRVDVAGRQAPIRGFIAGWGAYAAGTRIAHDEIAARGAGQVVRAVGATLRRALAGAEAQGLRQGIAVTTVVGNEKLPGQRCFIGAATTLPGRLPARLNPFWGDGEGAIRWLSVTAPPKRLWLAAPFAAFGRPLRWMHDAGYRSGRASAIDLTLDGGLVVDGEHYDLPPASPVRLSARETLRFLSF